MIATLLTPANAVPLSAAGILLVAFGMFIRAWKTQALAAATAAKDAREHLERLQELAMEREKIAREQLATIGKDCHIHSKEVALIMAAALDRNSTALMEFNVRLRSG